MSVICAKCGENVSDEDLCELCGQSTLLEGKYRLEHSVGSGAFGTTFRAQRLSDGAEVAVKEMLIRKADSLKSIELFEREARVLEKLNHPGIPKYLDDFRVEAGKNTAFYLVQEFVDGASLDAWFRPPVHVEDVFRAALQILDILTYLHALSPPVIHRDLKPKNLLRRADGQILLIDFGSVRAALDSREGGSTVAGTFGFMAPEQLMGRAVPQSDVFSLGATLVQLLSGEDPTTFMNASRQFDLGRLTVPARFLNILSTMVADEPEKRPTAAQCREAIQDALDGRSTALAVFDENTALARLPDEVRALLHSATPRALPRNFSSYYLQNSGFNIIFGGMFAGIGLSVPCIIGAAIPLSIPIMLIFVLVFGGVGIGTLTAGVRTRKRAQHVWRHGQLTSGRIVAIEKAPYKKNNRAARRYTYVFKLNGRNYEGHLDTWSHLAHQVDETVPVLFDELEPEKNLMVL